MAVRESTTFSVTPNIAVEVIGSTLLVKFSDSDGVKCWGLERAQGRDLSKALSLAADIVRTKRKLVIPTFPKTERG